MNNRNANKCLLVLLSNQDMFYSFTQTEQNCLMCRVFACKSIMLIISYVIMQVSLLSFSSFCAKAQNPLVETVSAAMEI